MRVFFVGPTAAGKTTLARQYATDNGLRYISCDDTFLPAPIRERYILAGHPNLCPLSVQNFLASCGDGYVMDNAPIDPTWETFKRWAAKNAPEVYCAVPESRTRWKQRKSEGGHELTDELWSYFWIQRFPNLSVPVRYILTPSGKEIDHKEAMRRVGMGGLIHDWMRTAGYDYRYQDIPEIGHTGYSGTAETWGRIKDLIGCGSVVDCGSFHGYMLFRRGEGTRIGLDFLDPALTVSRAVNTLRGDTVEFRRWRAGESVPEADVTLCLNALHHFPDNNHPLGTHCDQTCSIDDFFDTIKSPVVVFEAYTKYEDSIRSRWSVEKYESGRERRAIYLCRA